MSVDHLTVTPDAAVNGTPNGTATSTAIVLNAEDVHRDWRQVGAETAGVIAAVSVGGALGLAVFEQMPALMWVLACLCGVAFAAVVVFLTLMQREGRRWTYATDVDPT